MWFKNLALYRFSENVTLTAEEMSEKMQEHLFRACGQLDVVSYGWVAPAGQDLPLVHEANGFFMVCAQKQEKVLPNSVVNEMTAEKVEEMETQEARKLSRKERSAIKDEIIFQLLPQAFSFKKKQFAYLDVKGGWLVVDSASSNKAEDLLSLLRKSLGSLPVVPVNTLHTPAVVMTDWLKQQVVPQDIVLSDECELASNELEGATIRCKRHDLKMPEILQLLEKNLRVSKLAIAWSERLSFVLDEQLSIKRLKFLDLVLDKVDDIETETEIERFDADFSIMTLELQHFLNRLLELFGGEQPS